MHLDHLLPNQRQMLPIMRERKVLWHRQPQDLFAKTHASRCWHATFPNRLLQSLFLRTGRRLRRNPKDDQISTKDRSQRKLALLPNLALPQASCFARTLTVD